MKRKVVNDEDAVMNAQSSAEEFRLETLLGGRIGWNMLRAKWDTGDEYWAIKGVLNAITTFAKDQAGDDRELLGTGNMNEFLMGFLEGKDFFASLFLMNFGDAIREIWISGCNEAGLHFESWIKAAKHRELAQDELEQDEMEIEVDMEAHERDRAEALAEGIERQRRFRQGREQQAAEIAQAVEGIEITPPPSP